MIGEIQIKNGLCRTQSFMTLQYVYYCAKTFNGSFFGGVLRGGAKQKEEGLVKWARHYNYEYNNNDINSCYVFPFIH